MLSTCKSSISKIIMGVVSLISISLQVHVSSSTNVILLNNFGDASLI